MRKALIILVTLLAAASCTNPYKPTERTFKIGSTVNAYFKYIRIVEDEPVAHPIIAATLGSEEVYIRLSLVGEYIGSVYDLIEEPYGARALAYQDCQEKFGDFNPTQSLFRYYTSRKGGEWMIDSGECLYYCFGEQIVSINITSNLAWNEEYNAGADLAPLFTVEYSSLANYISSGFTDRTLQSSRSIVSELKREDIALMLETDWNIYGGTDMIFKATDIPENLDMHTITITLNLDNGESLSYSIRLGIF